MILDGFFKVLGRVWEGFWEDFSMILDFIRKTLNGVKGHETLRGRMNFEGRLLKKHANFIEKAAKNDANLQ